MSAVGRRAILRSSAALCLAAALTGSREVRSQEAASASTRPSAADAGSVNAEDLDRPETPSEHVGDLSHPLEQASQHQARSMGPLPDLVR
jgi:hypothetical protein